MQGSSQPKTLVQEKVAQAISILQENEIDLWMTVARETSAVADPVLPFIYGHGVTWQTAFILTRTGKRIIIIGHFDAETARRTEAYDEVIPYHDDFRAPLLEVLEKLKPQRIALNYSLNDAHADGLTHGLYQLLSGYLADTPFAGRFMSAEPVLMALRGRKTPVEIERIRTAVETTLDIFDKTFDYAQPGMTERQIGQFMHDQVDALGLGTSWERAGCPAVHAGPDTVVGHAGPTDVVLERGHILHFDFGVLQNEYASDLQRVVYYLRPGETAAPSEVQRAFDTVVQATQAGVDALKPGVPGREVDAVVRQAIVDAGYPAFSYATGHQMGRACHDGGALLGPLWKRYGNLPNLPVEPGHVYTIEPAVAVPGYGYLGLEEDVLVTDSGAVFLGKPQTELVLR